LAAEKVAASYDEYAARRRKQARAIGLQADSGRF
jgi:hypothetical protein